VSLLPWTGPAKAQAQPGRDPRTGTIDPRGTNRKANNPQFPLPRTLAPATAEAARPRLKPSSLLAAVESSQVRQREPLSAPGAAVPGSKSSVQFCSRSRCCFCNYFCRPGVSAPRIRSWPGLLGFSSCRLVPGVPHQFGSFSVTVCLGLFLLLSDSVSLLQER